jgi:hypothetical protein
MNTTHFQGHRGGENRRHAPRVEEHCIAVVELPGHREVEGETVDLSSAGVCLTLPEALDLGAQYRFHIDRIVDGQPHRLDLVGRVCFCISRGNQFRVGIHCPEMQLEGDF